ncbi:MAG: 1-deoxy-D-xylulose-5-phosphate synthase [Bacteroidetes bacterium]|nr:1-deoxy-D-xylulose-5-phosphate synthase [Bacteroidota bacterium]
MKSNLLDTLDFPSSLKKLSAKELDNLCHEIRELLISIVVKNGGHLASNLGVVELTVALHTVLDSPNDKILWDVSHQAYVHKILTGRKNELHTIRQTGGLSGFVNRKESPHDIFGAGHASTSLSAALGIAKARDIKGDDYSVFAVIGDGAMSGGLALEAINNVSEQVKGNFVVVLNDNEMSISRPVGSLASAITRIRTSSPYLSLKHQIENVVGRIPKIGHPLNRKIEKLVERTKNMITDFKVGVIFEELGFRYLGPIDGHNIPLLMSAFSYAKNTEQPVLIHVMTKKGKGYGPCEKDPVHFHGIGPSVDKKAIQEAKGPSYSQVFGDTLCQLAKNNQKICAITAAMTSGTGLESFYNTFPERFFDVGIAEEHAVTFAAGLASQGMKPVVAIYSTFLQRAYDQVIHDVCLQNLPVVFMLDRAGLVGPDGPTHHGVFDIAFLRSIPNMVVMAPKDTHELKAMLQFAVLYDGPISIRYPKGQSPLAQSEQALEPILLGKSEVVLSAEKKSNQKQICILALGDMVEKAVIVAKKLDEANFAVSIINIRFVKPLDKDLILKVSQASNLVVTLEDGVIQGGFGSAVLELFNAEKVMVPVLTLGLPDKFVEHGENADLYKKYNLDVAGIAEQILAFG